MGNKESYSARAAAQYSSQSATRGVCACAQDRTGPDRGKGRGRSVSARQVGYIDFESSSPRRCTSRACVKSGGISVCLSSSNTNNLPTPSLWMFTWIVYIVKNGWNSSNAWDIQLLPLNVVRAWVRTRPTMNVTFSLTRRWKALDGRDAPMWGTWPHVSVTAASRLQRHECLTHYQRTDEPKYRAYAFCMKGPHPYILSASYRFCFTSWFYLAHAFYSPFTDSGVTKLGVCSRRSFCSPPLFSHSFCSITSPCVCSTSALALSFASPSLPLAPRFPSLNLYEAVPESDQSTVCWSSFLLLSEAKRQGKQRLHSSLPQITSPLKRTHTHTHVHTYLIYGGGRKSEGEADPFESSEVCVLPLVGSLSWSPA